ncbi:MAG: endonuclease/exonuclease/phosphatase family protein [Schlesneria sp.]
MIDSISAPKESSIVGPLNENWFRRLWRFVRRANSLLIWSLVAVGLVLRFTIRDQFHPWAIVYYLTPIASLPIWLVLAKLLWGRIGDAKVSQSNKLLNGLNLIAIVGCAVWAFCSENIEKAKTPSSTDIPIVYWNTANATWGVDRLAAQIIKWDAPVVGLIEANSYYPSTLKEWQSQLPEYKVVHAHFGGLIAVKGTVKKQISHRLAPSSWCEQFDLVVGDDELTLLLVDISAQLSLSRRQPLQDLADLAENLNDRPLIILGDFNTPDDSVHLRPLNDQCRNIFRENGTGYAATWPMPLPVLALDQVWVNEHVNASKCEHLWSIFSDHRPVISSVTFQKPFEQVIQ